MDAHPVEFDVVRPARFARVQLLLRILVMCVLSASSGALWASKGAGAGLSNLLWLGLPVLAAIRLSQLGSSAYLGGDGRWLGKVLRWIVALSAWLALLTDRFTVDAPERDVRYDIHPTGVPTIGSALLRLLFTIPAAIFLAILGIAGFFTWWIGAIAILVSEQVPAPIWSFHVALVRWYGQMLAYHASLVDRYPHFDMPHDVAAHP